MLRRLEKILVQTIGVLVALYTIIVLIFSLPIMQQSLAGIAESILSDQLKSKVSIGSVNLGFLNRIIIDDIVVLDPHDEERQQVSTCYRSALVK